MNQEKQRKPNRLIHEKSPYLLQHAYNPVDWYPWSHEAFLRAEKENKPILLSIGYATCHWCHVMERESFEDEHLAEYLNSNFISIKLDREERPDIDKIYMDALHAMDQQGGWPLNMFLTPDKLPIAGGTYFPPEPRYGRKSFREILTIIKNAWDTRKEEILVSGKNLAQFLNSIQSSEDSEIPSKEVFESAFSIYKNYYDKNFYGFKTNNQNKFPPSMGLMYLMSYSYYYNEPFSLEMAENTLIAMKKGGIYDQVGGGLSRYSTDHYWLVPHFEKMLYDNALYLHALVDCFALTKKEKYKKFSYDIIHYIQRDMELATGGICSAEDADSEGEEGKFYLWEYDEIIKLLGEDASEIIQFWNIQKEGNFEGKNILHESFENDPKFNQDSWVQKLSKSRQILLEYRSKRERPLRDDKVLTSWNSLYIQSLAIAGRVFNDQSLIKNAERIYSFIEKYLYDENGRLLRRWREGESSIKAFLSDYSEFAQASLDLYEATGEMKYAFKANKLAEEIIKLFSSDTGIYFETGIDGETLIRRTIDLIDSVEPSGNSTLSLVFQKLSGYGFHTRNYMSSAEKIFKYAKSDMEKRALSTSHMLKSFLEYSFEKKEIVLVVRKPSKLTEKIHSFFRTSYIPNVIFIYFMVQEENKEPLLPILEGKVNSREISLYICRQGACDSPQFTDEDIRNTLKTHFPGFME